MLDFTGRSVFVTGGSRGVGRATALLFARTGADVALSYHTRRDAAEGVAAEIRALGRRAVVVGGDHADADAVGGMYAAIIEGLGGLDVFVANAGIWPERDVPLAEMPASRWAETLRANLDGVYLTTRAALQVLRPGGSVVLVSSTAGQRGEAYHADYAVTKGGLLALTKSLAIECAPDITVNCCAPGWIDTDMCGRRADSRVSCEGGVVDPARAHCDRRRCRLADPLPGQPPGPAHHRRDPQRERRQRAVRLIP